MAPLVVYLSTCVCLLLFSVLIKFIHKFWWTPICVQSKMRSQGIRGPSYKLFHGGSKPIIHTTNGSMTSPTEISHYIFPRIHPYIYSSIKLYGRNFIMWSGPKALLVVTEPELIKEILNDKDEAYSRKEISYFGKKLFGNGLATTRGRKWFKQRKLANHAFHMTNLKVDLFMLDMENLKNMIPTIIASVDMMLERWREFEAKEIDVLQEFTVLASEVISSTAFGSTYFEGEKIFDALTKLSHIFYRNSKGKRIPGISKLLKTPDDIESDKLEQGARDSIIKMIKKREKGVQTGELDNYGSDFLGILLNAYHSVDETQKISIEDVIDECKTFFFAGHESIAGLLSWIILLLATHTDWQDTARKEVLELFGQENPNGDHFTRLKSMSMIINETLRLYPASAEIVRVTKKQVKLGSVIVPANMDLFISVLALHHDPQIWGKDVHLFKPERFGDGVAKATSNNMAAFFPFGMGPRSCVGLNFSITEIKIALSKILQRYRFALSPTYLHSPVKVLSVLPQHGIQVQLHAL